jgi:hypothetical protein
MADVEKYAKELININKLANEFSSKIYNAFGGSVEWGINEVVSSYLSMFDRFCPFKEGDRVELVKDIDVNESSGWYGSRHFLIRGSKGTVRGREYRKNMFTFDIEFDNETWFDGKGNEHPVERKHVFNLNETQLRSSIV